MKIASKMDLEKAAAEAAEVTRHIRSLESKIADDLKEYHDSVAHFQHRLAEARQRLKDAEAEHELAVQVEDAKGTLSLIEGDLIANWTQFCESKTLGVPDGRVQLRVRKGVRVTDARAAARALDERDLWGFVKEVKVDAKLRSVLEAGQVPGVEPHDKATLAYLGEKA